MNLVIAIILSILTAVSTYMVFYIAVIKRNRQKAEKSPSAKKKSQETCELNKIMGYDFIKIQKVPSIEEEIRAERAQEAQSTGTPATEDTHPVITGVTGRENYRLEEEEPQAEKTPVPERSIPTFTRPEQENKEVQTQENQRENIPEDGTVYTNEEAAMMEMAWYNRDMCPDIDNPEVNFEKERLMMERYEDSQSFNDDGEDEEEENVPIPGENLTGKIREEGLYVDQMNQVEQLLQKSLAADYNVGTKEEEDLLRKLNNLEMGGDNKKTMKQEQQVTEEDIPDID